MFSVIQEGKKRNSICAFISHSLSRPLTHSSSSCAIQRLLRQPPSSQFLLMLSMAIAGRFISYVCILTKKNKQKRTSQYYYLLFLIVFPWLCRRSNYTSSWLLNNVTMSAFPNLQRWTTACDYYLTAVHSYSTVSPRSYKRALWQKLKVKIKCVLFFPCFFPPLLLTLFWLQLMEWNEKHDLPRLLFSLEGSFLEISDGFYYGCYTCTSELGTFTFDY